MAQPMAFPVRRNTPQHVAPRYRQEKFVVQRSVRVSGFWLKSQPSNPAYNDYRSPDDIKKASADYYWKIANVGAKICTTYVAVDSLQGPGRAMLSALSLWSMTSHGCLALC
jgi:hypothetical protein